MLIIYLSLTQWYIFLNGIERFSLADKYHERNDQRELHKFDDSLKNVRKDVRSVVELPPKHDDTAKNRVPLTTLGILRIPAFRRKYRFRDARSKGTRTASRSAVYKIADG